MADTKPEGRSSEGVRAIRHPRSEFAQQGWLLKPVVNATTSDLYEHNTDFGWFSETQSYRPYEHNKLYGPRSQKSVRAYYQTEPQQGWLSKPNLSLYEPNSGFGWFSETQSFRTQRHNRHYNISPRSPRPYYQTEQEQGWLSKPNLSLYEPNSGFGWYQLTQLPRQDRGRRAYGWRKINKVYYETTPAVFYDPGTIAKLHRSWTIPSELTRRHPARDLDRWDQEDTSWDVVNLTEAVQPPPPIDLTVILANWWSVDIRPLYDTIGFQDGRNPAVDSWTQKTDRTRTNRRYQRDTNTDLSFNFPNLRDPAIDSWTIPSGLPVHGRLPWGQRQSVLDFSWLSPITGTVPEGWTIPADRPKPPTRSRVQRDTNVDNAFIFKSLAEVTNQPPPPLDFTSILSQWWSVQVRPLYQTIGFQDGRNPAVDSWTIRTDRTKSNRRYQRDTNRDAAFIYENLPVVGDNPPPLYQPWLDVVLRQWIPREPVPVWFNVIIDLTVINSWQIDTARPPSERRKRWGHTAGMQDVSWITVPNNFGPLDPKLWPAIAELVGHRTPARARLQTQRQQYYSDLSFVHDVIPLTDPVATATIRLRPIAPIMSARRRNKRR